MIVAVVSMAIVVLFAIVVVVLVVDFIQGVHAKIVIEHQRGLLGLSGAVRFVVGCVHSKHVGDFERARHRDDIRNGVPVLHEDVLCGLVQRRQDAKVELLLVELAGAAKVQTQKPFQECPLSRLEEALDFLGRESAKTGHHQQAEVGFDGDFFSAMCRVVDGRPVFQIGREQDPDFGPEIGMHLVSHVKAPDECLHLRCEAVGVELDGTQRVVGCNQVA
mmetsp:Transcript_12502/g.36331  ORF Transcript_12502/g.36331 Transcript_12502/m.36331 type:complete len:219 (+) Transcript_12502:3563-4219(+)